MTNSEIERLNSLEELCAHQGEEIEQLSETARTQWEKIDQLTHALARFRDRLSEVEDTSTGPYVNTKPPHY